jgi:putative SOS response-associated peptidase YedK
MPAMCGRFVQAQPASSYAAYFGVGIVQSESLHPSYNVAPTDPVYAVADHDGSRRLGSFRWGLVPWFARDANGAARAINARMETVADKATFKASLARRRCLIPADGFYEWERVAAGKLPHYIHGAETEPLALAGLWASWRHPDSGKRLATCTILTGQPSSVVAPLHDRMPVMLGKEAWGAWLDPDARDPAAALSLLEAARPPRLVEHPVSSLVNSVRNNLADLIVPLDTAPSR